MNRDRQPTRSHHPAQRLDRTRQPSTPSTDWQDSRTTVMRESDGPVLPLDGAQDDAYDDPWPTKLPTSARRYDTQVWQQGDRRVVAHPRAVQPIPRRTSAYQQPPAAQTGEDVPVTGPHRARRRLHWLVYAGLGAMVALLVWAGAAWASAEWEDIHNDWTWCCTCKTRALSFPTPAPSLSSQQHTSQQEKQP